MLDRRNPNWDYVTPWGSLTGQQRARTLPPNCLIRSRKSVEVINADEDLRVTDGGGECGAVTGIGRVRMDSVLYNTPIFLV